MPTVEVLHQLVYQCRNVSNKLSPMFDLNGKKQWGRIVKNSGDVIYYYRGKYCLQCFVAESQTLKTSCGAVGLCPQCFCNIGSQIFVGQSIEITALGSNWETVGRVGEGEGG
jgi:hypothetical protein